VDGETRAINDLSTSGCFVLEPMSDRTPGARLMIFSQSNSLNFECSGEVMRVTATGIGVRFIRLPAPKKREIRRLLKNRFSLRQKVDIPCTWVFGYEESESRMVDLSSGGCFVHAQLGGLKEGADGVLKVMLAARKSLYSLPGHVVWINHAGAHQKPVGFGFQFDHRQGGFMQEATIHYGQGMLVR